ncbi:MAG: DUF1080 domain-containing protein [Verrucomicrobia bacterium]|nr:DUF1080 domain-containing protein [Verrucomicrobiota bacterium]
MPIRELEKRDRRCFEVLISAIRDCFGFRISDFGFWLSPRRILLVSALLLHVSLSTAAQEAGFTRIFDGASLNGWTHINKRGPGYLAQDGLLVCPANGGGNLFTEKEYENFVFRFEFKLAENGNNGIGIRSPLDGRASSLGMEIQILHDDGPEFKDKLRPAQYHGSVYDIIPATRGSLKPPGEWNSEEILADRRHIKVTVNGQVIVDANLNDVHDPATLQKHPGLLRERGHIGFLGHGTHLEFRNIRIKELPGRVQDNTPPPGFTALFNGRTIEGWKGLLAPPNDNPSKRAQLSAAERAAAQAKADERMRAHWKVVDGALEFDGQGDSLCTMKDYGDFELLVDWKIHENGDSGIYLRGSPQVQIWDPKNPKYNPKHVGSGGLFNNQKNPSTPSKVADKPIGEWNAFRILMVGEKAHVFLNGELVVNNVTLENYWERDQPIYPTGSIELQNHGDKLYFKNIYVREIPRSRIDQ